MSSQENHDSTLQRTHVASSSGHEVKFYTLRNSKPRIVQIRDSRLGHGVCGGIFHTKGKSIYTVVSPFGELYTDKDPEKFYLTVSCAHHVLSSLDHLFISLVNNDDAAVAAYSDIFRRAVRDAYELTTGGSFDKATPSMRAFNLALPNTPLQIKRSLLGMLLEAASKATQSLYEISEETSDSAKAAMREMYLRIMRDVMREQRSGSRLFTSNPDDDRDKTSVPLPYGGYCRANDIEPPFGYTVDAGHLL